MRRNLKRTKKFSAVFDTSVLIILTKLGYLDDAFNFFNKIEVPSAVVKELSVKENEAYFRIKELVDRKLITLEEVEKDFPGLGKGESSTIFIALIKGKVAVLDDEKARKLARDLGVTVMGTLALLKRLHQEGKLKESVEELYIKLTGLKFRVERHIFSKIFSETKEK